jgi:hypothetical protein
MMEIDPIDDGPALSAMSGQDDTSSAVSGLQPSPMSIEMMMAQQPPYTVAPPIYYEGNLRTGISPASTTIMTTVPPPPPPLALSTAETKLYLDQLRSEDLTSRITAAHVIDRIAVTLGGERTRTVRVRLSINARTLIHTHPLIIAHTRVFI